MPSRLYPTNAFLLPTTTVIRGCRLQASGGGNERTDTTGNSPDSEVEWRFSGTVTLRIYSCFVQEVSNSLFQVLDSNTNERCRNLPSTTSKCLVSTCGPRQTFARPDFVANRLLPLLSSRPTRGLHSPHHGDYFLLSPFVFCCRYSFASICDASCSVYECFSAPLLGPERHWLLPTT